MANFPPLLNRAARLLAGAKTKCLLGWPIVRLNACTDRRGGADVNRGPSILRVRFTQVADSGEATIWLPIGGIRAERVLAVHQALRCN